MIRFSQEAQDDLIDIVEWIANDSGRQVAMRVKHRIGASISNLDVFPLMGRAGRVAGTRELVIARLPYIAIYTVGEDTLDILRIIHAAMDWPQT